MKSTLKQGAFFMLKTEKEAVISKMAAFLIYKKG